MPAAAEALPWPDTFPDFVGYQFFDVADAFNGHGLHIWSQRFLGHTVTVTPPKEGGNSLAGITLHMEGVLVEVCADTDETMKSQTGKSVISEHSGEVDLAQKSFTLNTSKFISATFTEDVYSIEVNMEVAVSSDNLLLRMCDLSWEGAAGDNEGAFGFLFQDESTRPLLCPSLFPKRGPSLGDKMREVREFLSNAVLLQEGEPHVVEFELTWGRLSKIDTVETQFDAKVLLELRWLVNKQDVYDFIARPEGWQPQWTPGELAITNMASDGAASIQGGDPALQKLDARVYAVQALQISGSFFEDFELQYFPTDVQPLNIHLQFHGPDSLEFRCVRHSMQRDSVQASEWEPYLTRPSHTHRKFSEGGALGKAANGRHDLTVTAYVQRKSFVFIMRIIFVMTLLQGISLTVLAMEPKEDFGDQLGNCLTLLLTAVAYSLVVASSLPVLGYLTFLDKYILASLVYIVLVTGEVTALALLGRDADELRLWSDHFFYFDVALLAFNVLATGGMFVYMGRAEKAKVC